MPKIIKNPEDRILQAARNRLLDKDLSSFSLRGVAADCGIAVGTIYNYFKDKESLMAAVMIQDWMDALKGTREGLMQSQSLQEGLLHICRGIRNFCLLYQKVWSSYPTGGEFSMRYSVELISHRRRIQYALPQAPRAASVPDHRDDKGLI